jgi:hypothetical protein
VDLINFFGDNDGFSQIIDRINEEDHKILLSNVLYYIKAVDQVSSKSSFSNLFYENSNANYRKFYLGSQNFEGIFH